VRARGFSGHVRTRSSPLAPLAAPSPAELEEVLALVAARTGADLRGQRVPMLERRVLHDMALQRAATPAAYLARLRGDEAAAWALLGRLTVKVSRFFRNPEVFAALRDRVLPTLRAARGGAPLRVWSAGCARGQEPYSLAMLLDAAGCEGSVLATDVDPGALAAARAGIYPSAEVVEVPFALAARALEPLDDGRVAVSPGTAARVRFAGHDLTSPRPPDAGGPFDLVCCRNVLIYFVREAQAAILARLLALVAPGGFLCLGEAEWPAPHVAREVEVFDRTLRIFRTPARPGRRGGATA
jgi:chemotaxis protein methyltransferase CheR